MNEVAEFQVRSLNPETLEKAAAMLRVIAHPVRISILGLLEDGGRMTVSEIHKSLDIGQSTASHHLGLLKDKDVLGSQREGKNTYYYLRHANLKNILQCVSMCQK